MNSEKIFKNILIYIQYNGNRSKSGCFQNTSNLYAANQNGEIIHIFSKLPIKGSKTVSCYDSVLVKKIWRKNKKARQSHRFIWECFNGIIPGEKVIDHINNIKDENRIYNLQLITPQENTKKSAKNRGYSFAAQNHPNSKCVKSINLETKDV